METTEVILTENAFADSQAFEMAQRMAIALSKSDLIPKQYIGNIPNIMIALELSKRTGVSPIMVMQNLNVIQGKPSWSSSFIIAVINSYKKFAMPLNFILHGEGDKRSCIAFTIGVDGQRYESPSVDIAMAVAEGWVGKPGSKWKTMPDLMLRYRSASFFGRLYCPELLMGMQSEDEIIDVHSKTIPIDKQQERKELLIDNCKTLAEVEDLQNNQPQWDADLFDNKKQTFNNGSK